MPVPALFLEQVVRQMVTSLMCLTDKVAFAQCLDADIDTSEFVKLYKERDARGDVLIPKSIDAMFSQPETEEERVIHWLILKWDALQVMRLESAYFSQLQEFEALNHELLHRTGQRLFDQRNALAASIGTIKWQLATLQRTGLLPEDHRIDPGMPAPVLVYRSGALTIQPMRYGQATRALGELGLEASAFQHEAPVHELRTTWAGTFGRCHGIVMLSGFYLDDLQRIQLKDLSRADIGRPPLVRDRSSKSILVPCMCSGSAGGSELATFTPISDRTEGDLLTAGYPRCLLGIKRGRVKDWLDPTPTKLGELENMLRQRSTATYALAA